MKSNLFSYRKVYLEVITNLEVYLEVMKLAISEPMNSVICNIYRQISKRCNFRDNWVINFGDKGNRFQNYRYTKGSCTEGVFI